MVSRKAGTSAVAAVAGAGALGAMVFSRFKRETPEPEEQSENELQHHVADMLGLIHGIVSAFDTQLASSDLPRHQRAQALVSEARATLDGQAQALTDLLEELHWEGASMVKSAASSVGGRTAGIFGRMRTNEVSRMMRDDYTALSLASISYTMLHTTGLSLHNDAVAALAQRHLAELTPLVMRFGEVVPGVVVRELAREVLPVDVDVSREAVEHTRQAWVQAAGG
jgi:hypothetical protein